MNFSEDKDTASNGGDMGFIAESALHQNASLRLYDAITRLKPGQFTDIVPIVDPGPEPHEPWATRSTS